jgi:serine/threonine protein kinase/WD40 repeat protein
MNSEQTCPSCGKPVAPNAPKGLCPTCVLAAGFATGTDCSSAPAERGKTTAFIAPQPYELRSLFPQLEILELLGQGGMGAVYKARQLALDRFVALKVLPPRGRSDPGFGERFTREALTLAKLGHPNIVAVYDFGQANGLPYFIMEYVDGPTLRQIERAGKLSPAEALRIIPQICEALQFAHAAGIVHRDVKPENILVEKTGRVKIADFGVAKILGQTPSEGSLTGVSDLVGTPHYMAPEQIEHPQEVDHRADIYSLGVVFYEMLTGELPLGKFSAPSRKAAVDARLDEVVFRTLEKEREQRYQQATAVKTDVERIMAHRPLGVGAPASAHLKGKGRAGEVTAAPSGAGFGLKRVRDLVVQARTGLLALGVALGVLVVLLVVQAFIQKPTVSLRFWTVDFSPDGKLIATVGGASSPNEPPALGELIFWNANTGKKKLVYKQQAAIRTVAWMPDGSAVAIGDFQGSTKLVSPRRGKVAATLPSHPGGSGGLVNAVAVSADGKLVASGSFDGTVSLWDTAAGRALEPLSLPGAEGVSSIAVSPDHSLVLVGGRSSGRAYLFNLAEEKGQRVLDFQSGSQLGAGVEAVGFGRDGASLATGSGRTLKLWETATGKQLREFSTRGARIEGLAFAPDGMLLATVDEEGVLRLWNSATGERVSSTLAHARDCFGLSFSRDGKCIATVGRRDFTAKIWDAETLALRKTMCLTNPPNALAWLGGKR